MKQLRWFVALVALLVVPLCVSAAPAMASNCSSGMSTTYYIAGFLSYEADIYGCSSVDKVEFKRTIPPGTIGTGTAYGWWDNDEYNRGIVGDGNPNGSHLAPWAYNLDDSVQNITSGSSVAATVWRVQPWCGGGTHFVSTWMVWRIHATGGQWGPWHWTSSIGYQIVC